MNELLFMGDPNIIDDVRCRIYGCGNEEDERIVFLRACAGRGAIDCPAYDGFVAALQGRGWLPKSPDLEPNPDGEGRIGRWRLTTLGLAEVRKLGIRLE